MLVAHRHIIVESKLYRNGNAVIIGVEKVAPYAVFGDRSSNYNTTNLATGSYKLVASAFSSSNL